MNWHRVPIEPPYDETPKRTLAHEAWLASLVEIQASCRHLHFLWKAREQAARA